MGRSMLTSFSKNKEHHLIAFVVLVIWSVLPTGIANYLFYPIFLAVTACIARAGYEQAKLRREALLSQYLLPSSTLRKPLAVGPLSMVIIFPVAVFMALILLLDLRSGGWAVWGALLAGFLVYQWCRRFIVPLVDKHVVDVAAAPIARAASTFPAAVSMIIVSVAISLIVTHPYVEGKEWLETVAIGTAHIDEVGVLSFFERLHLGVSLTEYWAIQNSIKTLGTPVVVNVLGWTLFFVSQCAFVWAFCRLVVGIESIQGRVTG